MLRLTLHEFEVRDLVGWGHFALISWCSLSSNSIRQEGKLLLKEGVLLWASK